MEDLAAVIVLNELVDSDDENPRNKKMDKKEKREGIFYKHNPGTYR